MANVMMDTGGGSKKKSPSYGISDAMNKRSTQAEREARQRASEKQAAAKAAQAEKEYQAQKKAEAANKAKEALYAKQEAAAKLKAKQEAAKKTASSNTNKAKTTTTSGGSKQNSNSNKQTSNNTKQTGGSTKQTSGGGNKKTTTTTTGGGTDTTDGTGNLQLDQLLDLIPDLSSSYTQPAYTDVITPALKTATELADLFGLSYDKDAINKIFNDAVAQEYATRYAQQGITEGNYYDQMAALQNTSLDTLRQQQAQAIQNGASKGMQAANQLSAILGISQTAAQTANTLAQARGLLGKEHGAAQAKAIQDAMSYYDQMGMGLGEISKQLYSYDVQQQAAQLGYNQGINTDAAGVAAQNMAAQAAQNAALAQSIANIFGSQNSQAASNYASDQNYASNVYTANTNKAASDYAANQNYASNVYAANASANASKYAADQNAKAYATSTTSNSNKNADTDLYNAIVNSSKLPDYLKNQMISTYFK